VNIHTHLSLPGGTGKRRLNKRYRYFELFLSILTNNDINNPSLDFVINRFFVELFNEHHTKYNTYRKYFSIELSNVQLSIRTSIKQEVVIHNRTARSRIYSDRFQLNYR